MGRTSTPRLNSSLTGRDVLAGCVTAFAHNLLVNTGLKRLDARAERILERLDLGAVFTDLLAEDGKRSRRNRVVDGVREYLKRVGRAPRRVVAPPAIARNLKVLSRLLGLDETERALLLFLVALKQDAELREMAEAFPTTGLAARARVIAAAVGGTHEDVQRALEPRARLLSSGLISLTERRLDISDLELKSGLSDLLVAPGLDAERLLQRYFPVDRASALDWPDFQHLGEAPQLVATLLESAVAARRKGVNILFYGATGTGKTELARLVASRCGLRLHPAGKTDAAGESATAQERVSSLQLGNRLLSETASVLLFDEWEDLFQREWFGALGPRARTQLSKQWFNELLDTNPVPTLWISNSIEGVDPAFLRRFTYALEFLPLGARQRVRALERHLRDTPLAEADVRALAERFDVSPAQLGSAVSAARLLPSGVTRPALEKLLTPTEKLVHGGQAKRPMSFDASVYRLDALNAKEDLRALADSLAEWQPGEGPGLSLCLYGPPGTGKSEFAKYLAHRMGRRLVYRRVSDIQSMWVGEAEKNIARAFAEAEADDAVLLFDEADSFLCDRRTAQHSWEVSQVNEFLQQLEAFRGVVVCTSNLWADLDAASLRRFVFKVEFGWLRPEQAEALFETTLGPLLSERNADVASMLAQVSHLAPGDFAAVARKLKATRRRVTAREAVELLRAEVAVKPGAPRAVGFLTG